MSYVSATKQLLADDLRGLISHFTGFEPSSPSFKRIEDFAWREIIHKYHPTVDDQEIRDKVEGFTEKFLFHGFHQKAANLKNLVERYCGLDYFKNSKDGNLKWGLIFLLIKLSRKPTDALEDDEPICIENVCQQEDNENEPFDWASFLKEGWEKFKLPEDDILFSGDEVSFTEHRHQALSRNTFVAKESSPENDSNGSRDNEDNQRLNELMIQEKLEEYLNETRKLMWWNHQELEGAEQSYCRKWELSVRNEGILVEPTRIYSEDKVVWDFIRLFGSSSTNSMFIEYTNGCLQPKPNVSLSVLNPFTFGEILRCEVCRYLPYIKILNDFIEGFSSFSISDKLPSVYVAYSYALNEIIKEFRKRLVEFEKNTKEKGQSATLRSLFIHVKPWLRDLKKLSSTHSRAIYADYENVENWMCNVRLLAVLFNELETLRYRAKFLTFRLFLSSFCSYLNIVEGFMKSDKYPDPREDFLIFKPEDGSTTLEVRPYSQVLSSLKIPSNEFFDSFVSVCLRAVSSSNFLSQLGKIPTVTKEDLPKGFLNERFLSILQSHPQLSDQIKEHAEPEKNPLIPRPLSSPLVPTQNQKLTCQSIDFLCLQKIRIPSRSTCDKFFERASNSDLSTCTLRTVVEQSSIVAVTENMEPEGFLYVVFQNDFKLLDHLKSLRTVFFVQRLHSFLVYLFNKIMIGQQRSVNWNEKFQDCLSDELSNDMNKNFFFTLGPSLNSKTSDILQQLALIKILYKPDPRLKSIITDVTLKVYNDIFLFLVQFNWSYKSLFKLRFNLFEETKGNVLRLRRLYSMKMWLIHLMNSLCVYFNSTNEDDFEKSLIKLFGEARDLQIIRDAHYDFLVECKKHFFLNRGNPCKVLIQRAFKLCSTLMLFWHLERNQKLKEFQLNGMEEEYLAIANALPIALQKKRVQRRSSSLNRLFEAVRHNIPSYS